MLFPATLLIGALALHVMPANGFPGGGSLVISHCKDLVPAHGVAGQTSSPAPYTVTTNISTSGYTPNTQYTVTIRASNSSIPFRGFIIQMRNYNNLTTVGAFTQWDAAMATTGNCDRVADTITHMNTARADLPNEMSFTWMSPGTGTGPVRIWSSMVHRFTIFWIKGFVSGEIPEENNVAAVTMAPPTEVVVDLTTCGTVKGCYRYPNTCSSQATCAYIYTQRVFSSAGTQYIEVELSTTNRGWAAVGYSVDRIMGGTDSPPDDVLACQDSGAGVRVKNGNIFFVSLATRAHRLDNVTNVDQGITTLGASLANGVLACRFRRRLYTGSPYDKDLREPYNQFYVYDPTPGGNLASLNYHAANTPLISAVNITATSTAEDLNMPGSASSLTSSLALVAVTLLAVLLL